MRHTVHHTRFRFQHAGAPLLIASALWLSSVQALSAIEPSTIKPSTRDKPASDAPQMVVFQGTCDASGAIPLSDTQFMVADDEDNILRVYDATLGGPPVATFNLTDKITHKVSTGKWDLGAANLQRELDIESATRIGDTSLWLTSHGRNAKGKRMDERFQLLALQHDAELKQVQLVGTPYRTLIDDLAQEPRFAAYRLNLAAKYPAESEYAINIEGMTARRQGGVYIGFRNPVPNQRALIITLENPLAVMQGKPPVFGSASELDLGGLGIRGLSNRGDRILIAAGDRTSGDNAALYDWQGESHAPVKRHYDLPDDFNAEAFFTPNHQGRFMVLSDDGARLVSDPRSAINKPCKKLKDPALKSFRGAWLNPPTPSDRKPLP